MELQSRLDEYEQLIEAIKGGEVDAFALKTNNQSAVFTLNTVDYAYRLLVESFGDGALNLSEEALIVYTNNYFPELLNLSYEKVIGNSFFQFVHPESEEIFKELFKVALTGKAKGEINLFIADTTIPVYISLTSLFPTVSTVGMIITDLTEKRKQEEILRIQNVDDVKTEMRTLIEKESNNLSPNAKDYLLMVQDSAQRMKILIQDLLTYSNTNTADRKIENTDLNQIIDEIKDDLKDELNTKHAVVEATELHMVDIIPFQFRQIMENLIGNALKYINPSQPPHIIIKSEIANGIVFNNPKLSPQKKYCHISVSDNGIGFEPEYNEKIFEVFYRLHTHKEFKGTGVGLAIVKKIIENHGGLITANSKLNNGTTFDMYIPTT